ncbi:nucleoid-associated protein [Christiangramia sp.]|uniref:nucleoid-associated protein n=1 Tax=Christiangramia sp. TaxID=1931228 RepID=UPI002627EC84|nr:nucleoid-associated protein [Christiangramia sp.]
MLNLFGTTIENLFIHRVGNASRGEGKFLAKEETILDDEVQPLIKEYFLKPFRQKEASFLRFHHEVDLEYNYLYNLSRKFLGRPEDVFNQFSELIATHLYSQSSHPHIKAGEVYICYLKDLVIDNERVDGIGIFKSEIKQDFLQFVKEDRKLAPKLEQGVNLGKLDKGAIIFNTAASEGYKILSIDNNRYDTKYWLDNFLGVVEFEDETYFTKKYLKFTQAFAKDVVEPAEDKKESILFANRAINYFGKNDEFQENNFLDEVIRNPDLKPEFQNYKQTNGPKYGVEDLSTFGINNTAVKDSQKKFKSLIELDTNITIKMDFINPESADRFIEKGWDEDKQMYYYLCYFNSEKK